MNFIQTGVVLFARQDLEMIYMQKKPLWTKDFISVSLSSFFIFFTFYVLLTTLPIFVVDHLEGSEAQIGLVVTVFLISAVICRPFTGKWIEDFGRKKMLYFSLIIFLLSAVFYMGIKSFPLLLLLRFIHGIGFGMATTVLGTIVADLIPDERRGEGMGYYSMSMNLAMVAGPFMGIMIATKTTFTILFIICGIAAFLALILGFFAKFPDQVKGPVKIKEKMSFKSLFEVSTLRIAAIAGILSFSYAGLMAFISVYAKQLGLVEAASFFFVVYAVTMIAARPFTGRWFDMKGENVIIYPGMIIFAIGLILLSQVQSAGLLLVSGAIIGLGYGSLTPSFQTVAINQAAPHRRGAATATFFTLFDGGFALGSFTMGLFAASVGYAKLYLYCGILVFLTLPLYYFLHGRYSSQRKART